MTPAKITSVARPRIIGPITFSATEITPSTSTATTPKRSGRSRPTSRRADGPKSIAFSTGCPAPPHGGPAAPALGRHAPRGGDRVRVLPGLRRRAHGASSLTLVGRVRGAAVLDGELASSLTSPPR